MAEKKHKNKINISQNLYKKNSISLIIMQLFLLCLVTFKLEHKKIFFVAKDYGIIIGKYPLAMPPVPLRQGAADQCPVMALA